MNPDTAAVVSVDAPARLHLGFLDPSGSLGRRFGSIGLVIEGPATQLEISAADADAVFADTDGAAGTGARWRYLQRLREHTGRRQPLRLRLRQVLPPHAGLGSGTQLALAIGRAFTRWQGLNVDAPTLATWLGRGLRSGVGIAGFDHGGLLVDGGPGADGRPAPLLARVDLPSAWRVVLVQDTRLHGLSGGDEKQALAALPPLPQAAAAEVCHQVLMRILPGAALGEFAVFAAGVTHVQRVLGEHFAPAQQGRAFTSAAVGRLVQWLGSVDLDGEAARAAIGQSSWGPTGFAVLPSQASADALLLAARAAGVVDAALDVRVVAARNHGALLRAQPFTPAPHSLRKPALMERPYILHMFTPGRQMSPFDVNMAADAGYQIIVPYCEVGADAVAALTQDAIFSRGPKGAARTGIFIGGRDPLLAADMQERAKAAMVKPFVVSLMADPSGAYTTAAALVACVESALQRQSVRELRGLHVLVLGGTGPVGRIAGVIAAQAGAKVVLSSRSGAAAAEQVARETGARFAVDLHGVSGSDREAVRASLAGAQVVLACAAAGVQVLSADDLASAKQLEVAADINAVPPAGIAGVGVMDNAVALAGTKTLGIGALAVGNVKYQTQQRLLVQMREAEKPVSLGFVEAFATARAFIAESAKP